MPLLILKLLGIGRWIKSAATGAFKWIAASPVHMLIALCAVLALSNAWTWRGRQAARVAAAKWEIAFDKQKATYELAQKAAEAKQRAADQANLSGQLAANRELDKAHAQLETARAGAVADYLRSHRLQGPAGSASCRASVASMHPSPPAPDSGRADSDLVAVKPADIEAWSKVEVQNADRGNFIRGLIAQGLAVEGT